MFGRRSLLRRDPRVEFERWRAAVLGEDPGGSGWQPTARLPDVFAVVVETGLPWGASTLVARADGSVEERSSSGKTRRGGGPGQDDVRAAARGLLLVAQARLADLAAAEPADAGQAAGPAGSIGSVGPAEPFPAPPAGFVALRALTRGGVRSLVVRLPQLAEGSHPVSTLYFAAAEVLRQLDLLD